MISYQKWNVEFLQYSSFQWTEEGSVSCKTVPYYIFAQALEGHYSLYAAKDYVCLEEGEAFLTAPGQPLRIFHHINRASGNMHVRYVHFKLSCYDVLDPLENWLFPLKVGREKADLIGAMVSRLEQLRSSGTMRAMEELSLLFPIVREICSLGSEAQNRREPPEWLMQVMQYVYRHRYETVEVKKMCTLCGKSRAAFYRDFTAVAKMTPAAYVTRIKMQAAAQLLATDRELLISDVADRCSFANAFHFSRAFKNYFGVSPGEYRRLFPV